MCEIVTGNLALAIDKVIGGSGSSVALTSLATPFITNTEYNIRFQAFGTNPTRLRAKVWPIAQVEPMSWNISIEDSEPSLQFSGNGGLRAGGSSDFAGDDVVVAFDNLSISVLTPEDFYGYRRMPVSLLHSSRVIRTSTVAGTSTAHVDLASISGTPTHVLIDALCDFIGANGRSYTFIEFYDNESTLIFSLRGCYGRGVSSGTNQREWC